MATGGMPQPSQARFALAHNLRQYMAEFRKGYIHGLSSRELEKQMKAAQLEPVSYKTIDRLLNPYQDVNPRFKTIDALAWFFGIETWEFIKPAKGAVVAGREPRSPETPLVVASQQKTRRKDKA